MKRRNSNAFTLIETLLALTLGVLTFSSLLGLFFSFLQVWTSQSQNREFRQHVDGVYDFLDKALNGLSFPVEGWPHPHPVTWKRFAVPHQTKEETVLATTLRRAPVFLQEPYGFSTPVVFYFYHQPNEGLFLSYEGKAWEKSQFSLSHLPKETYRKGRFLISPWVTEWSYGYYDVPRSRWDFRSQPIKESGNSREHLPHCLRITFDNGSSKETRHLRLRKLNPQFAPEESVQRPTSESLPRAKPAIP
jgi:hypothetical protein